MADEQHGLVFPSDDKVAARAAERETAWHSEYPWKNEAYAVAHSGLWRAAYAPRSALGLAAWPGVGGSRG